MDYIDFGNNLVQKALRSGATAAEAYIETGKNLQIEVNKAKIQKLQRASFRGTGLRIFIDGKVSCVSSSDFSDDSVNKLIEKGISFARESDPEEFNVLPDLIDSPGEKELEIYDENIPDSQLNRKIDMAKELEQLSYQESPKIKNVESSSYSDLMKETFICNSRGQAVSWKESKVTLFVTPVAEENGYKQIAAHGLSMRNFEDLPHLAEISSKAAGKALLLLGGEKIKSQIAPVVFHPDSGIVILYGLISGINGESVYRNQSFLCEKVNQRIASLSVSIVDNGSMKRGVGTSPMDDEGIPTSKKNIINEGILETYIYNTYSAKKSGLESTGNAKRESYENPPGIGIFNFYLEKGNMTPEEIIKEVPEGLYVIDIIGGGPNHITGDFSCGVAGVWIKNGELKQPVAKITVAGNLNHILTGIDAVGSDLEFNQHIAAPTFRVAHMSVGGL